MATPKPYHPDIKIKKVTINDDLSEETICFSCTVYVGSRPAFLARNRGNGGETQFTVIDENKYRLAEAYAASLPPVYTNPPTVMQLSMDLELLIFQIVGKVREDKWLRQQCRSAVLWCTPDMPEGKWNTLPNTRISVALEEQILREHPDAEIANLRFTRKNAK